MKTFLLLPLRLAGLAVMTAGFAAVYLGTLIARGPRVAARATAAAIVHGAEAAE